MSAARAAAGPGANRGGTRWLLTRQDGHRVLTWLAVVGFGSAGLLRWWGVPSVDAHGPLHQLGVMDPLCGGTRAAFLLASGDLAGAAEYNPVVFPLALGGLLVLVRAVAGWGTGTWFELRWSPKARWVTFGAFLVTLAALGVRQQLHAALLTTPWTGG